jgi:SAM-dependent MidA family methyltransferase
MAEVATHTDAGSSLTLAQRLTETIRREGPITLHDWMRSALYDPSEGYYNRSDLQRWGREGDYRTSPERSELFASTFARYFANLYDELKRPNQWTIVESGAGDGRFASGVLHTLETQFSDVFDATSYVVDEVSSGTRQRAQERVAIYGSHALVASLAEIQSLKNPGIVFSNELLDALPVHRLIVTNGELLEFYVSVTTDGNFAWSTGPLSTPEIYEFCREHDVRPVEGQIVEVNLEIEDWFQKVAKKLTAGYVITVDYGADANDLYDSGKRSQGTLRAFSRHAFADVLAQPGAHDITTTVNWTQVKALGERFGFKVVDFMPQDKFLLRAGLLEEMERLLGTTLTDAEKLRLTTSAREMILPGGMASSFQVLVQRRL